MFAHNFSGLTSMVKKKNKKTFLNHIFLNWLELQYFIRFYLFIVIRDCDDLVLFFAGIRFAGCETNQSENTKIKW